MKTAYVFAGQGAQYPGMGRDLYEKYPEAKAVFDAAGDRIKQLCFEGTAEQLKETENTQPCVYTMTMAAYEAFRAALKASGAAEGAEPYAMAGFSLGEYSAMTAAGIITDIKTGTELMENRGRWMGEAGRDEEGNAAGTMAAAIGDKEKVLEIVEETRNGDILIAANFNAPTQTVVSGSIAAVERFSEKAKEAKLRVAPLAVGSAFHSPMMEPASGKMKALITEKSAAINTGSAVSVYSNLTAAPLSEYKADGSCAGDGAQAVEDIADAMAKQLMSPVRWVEIVKRLIDEGVDTFIEFGPGKTLCGLVKKTDRKVKAYNVENCETLESAIKGIKEAVEAENAQ